MLANLRSSAAIAVIAAALAAGGAAFAVTSNQGRAALQFAQAEQMPGQGQMMQQPGMMGPGMGRGSMMGRGMMGAGDTKRSRKMRMRGHMMKVMFAIADQDGDGALSFEEVTDIHRRIFNSIDADNDGRVTPEELRNFLQD